MSAVIPFVRPAAARPGSWSQQELAEFYRVEAALIRAGIGIASEHGVSDEGEPWFVFCLPDGDAIMHFARIDGSYLIASEVLDQPVRGADFRALIDQIARLHPNLLPIPAVAAGTKLVVHPAALLAALVAAAALSLSSEDARAGEIAPGPARMPSNQPSEGGGAVHDQPPARTTGPADQAHGRKQVEAIILSTMIFAAEALAGDHGDASADLGHLLSDLANGTAHHLAQGDSAPGTSGGVDAGLGGASMTQAAVLTAQGSGASQHTPSMGGRSDPAPAVRTDNPGDKAGFPGREAEPHASSSGSEVGPARVAAGTAAVGTGGQQVSATGHSEAAAGPSTGSGTDGGDQRGHTAQPSTSASSAQPWHAEAAQSDAGSETASQAWVHAAGQADANRTPAASISRDGGDRGGDHGHGSRAEAQAADDGHGSGRVPSGDGDHGSPARKADPASGENAPVGDSGKVGHEAGSAERSDHRGPGAPDTHAVDHSPGRGTPAADVDARSGSAQDASSSHATVVPTAPSQEPSHGPETKAGDRDPSPAHEPSSEHGPGAPSDSGPAHAASDAASASSGPPHGGPDDANAHVAAAPEDTAAPAPAASHAAHADTGAHPDGGPASHGQGPDAADATAQDHPNPSTPPLSSAKTGSGRDEPSHADQTQPEHATPSPQSGQDGMVHGAAGGPPAAHGGSSPPAESSHQQAAVSDPVDHGSKQTPLDKASGAAAGPSSDDGTAVQTATLPPQGQVTLAGADKNHPSDHGDAIADQPALPRAAIDPNGNLVFHAANHQDASPSTASHGPDDSAAHPDVGLVGLSDHGHVVHDLYHHG